MREFYPEGGFLEQEQNGWYMSSAAAMEEAMQENIILEARAVLCDHEHNLIVDLGFGRGIIPRLEGALGVAEGNTRDIAMISRVGKPVCFVVTRMQKRADGLFTPILSRRAAQSICMNEYVSRLVPGDVIPGRVTHLENFGCFVDIGCGIPSLLPIDQTSVSRIAHPSDRFRPGQEIFAVVKNVSEGRIALSHKELLGTWEENAALFRPGETVAGIIRSVEEYGVFVELTPNLAGLAEPFPGARIGQHTSVYIKSIVPDKMKIKLIIVDAFDAKYPTKKPEYFITDGHIDRWVYSTPGSGRIIETIF